MMEPHKPAKHARHGRWVKTSTNVPGAHKSPDGKCVGIYQAAREAPPITVTGPDGKVVTMVQDIPEHVVFTKPDGTNLMRLNEKDEAVKVCVSPAQLEGLESCHLPNDLPPGRKHDVRMT